MTNPYTDEREEDVEEKVLSLRRRLAAMFGYQEEEDEKERGGDCGLWSFWF